jgi:hypothetical protein
MGPARSPCPARPVCANAARPLDGLSGATPLLIRVVMGRRHGIVSTRTKRRATGLALAGLILTATLLAGCLDVVFPQGERGPAKEEIGLLRVWLATSPGSLGREFAHYNVSFGPLGVATDVYLTNYLPMQSAQAKADLVRMERDKLTAQLGQAFLPEGQYYAIASQLSRATVAIERIVGTTGNGQALTRAEERPILHNTGVSEYRSDIWVLGGRTTDVFLEVDLQRSLQRGNGGELHHTTILTRITILIDGNRFSRMPYDGGRSDLDPDDPRFADIAAERRIPLTKPPLVNLLVHDTATDTRLYSNVPGTPTKRLNLALGLHQELRLDASGSASSYLRGGQPIPIVEYIWDFGDGTTARGPTTTKAYAEGGIYDIVITVRDGVDLVASDHLTVFVPYTKEQAVRSDRDGATGTLYVPRLANDAPALDDIARHYFSFPAELEAGNLRLGGYHIEAVARDPLGGSYSGSLDLKVHAKAGHFDASMRGTGPWTITTAAVPAWRGPLLPWVDDDLVLTLELKAGVLVSYELVVEPLYYYNLSRGLDGHGAHIHGPWTLGPSFMHLDWDGRVREE